MHEDPWARTHEDAGWPFACKDTCEEPPTPAEGAILGFDVDSGDVWASSDSAWFVHDDRTASPDTTWEAFVSTPNSHVEPFAKACLMARASLDPAAPYFAVCRPADDEPLRVQWRDTQGGTSVATEHAISPDNTLDGPGAAFVRLRVDDDGTCAFGEGSADGTSWIAIDDHCFDAPLVLQGITASSHDAGVVRLLVGNVTIDGAALCTLGDFAEQVPLGDAAAVGFDGVVADERVIPIREAPGDVLDGAVQASAVYRQRGDEAPQPAQEAHRRLRAGDVHGGGGGAHAHVRRGVCPGRDLAFASGGSLHSDTEKGV